MTPETHAALIARLTWAKDHIHQMGTIPERIFTDAIAALQTAEEREADCRTLVVDIRTALWEVLPGVRGEDRTLVGMVKMLALKLEESRDNRRGEYELRDKAESRVRELERELQTAGERETALRLQLKAHEEHRAFDPLMVKVASQLGANNEQMRLRLARSNERERAAFTAGYHCQWVQGANARYIFDPLLKPGDPDGAWAAWQSSLPAPPVPEQE